MSNEATVSVIIPSRLGLAPDGELWCRKAVRSVLAQTAFASIEEIILAFDDGAAPRNELERLCWGFGKESRTGFTYGPKGKKSHVSAMNTACERARGTYLAFLEDDDLWQPRRLEYGLGLIAPAGSYYAVSDDPFSVEPPQFVSCSQREVAPDGRVGRVNDFPTCSGWLMRRAIWKKRPFAESYRIHWDNDYLGWLNKMEPDGNGNSRRLHLVEANADASRPWLANVARYSRIMATHEAEPLVTRVVHADSIMGTMLTGDAERKARSQKEYAALEVAYGCVPW